MLLSRGEFVRFPKGDFIFQEDEPGTTLYVILEGRVRIQKKSYRGEAEELATLHPSDFFGEMAILDEQLRSATAQAVDNVHLFVLGKSGLKFLTTKNPEFLTSLAKVLVARLRRADEIISQMEKAAGFQEKVLESLTEERERIALELHDGPMQTVSAATMQLSLWQKKRELGGEEELARLETKCREAVEKMREVVFNLYPRTLEEQGIVQAMRDRLEEVKEAGLAVELKGGWEKMPRALAQVLFSVFLEGTNNVVKHAQAKKLSVSLEESAKFWKLVLEDDGRGVRPKELEEKLNRPKHFGLLSCKRRVEAIGGSFSFESEEGRGSLLKIEVPKLG